MPNTQYPHPGIEPIHAKNIPLDVRISYFPPTGLRNYIDLRWLYDDKTVLKNPHKGWFWHYIDNGLARPLYWEEHDPNDSLEDFPGMNHLYLRFDWGDIEKEEGRPDWSPIDKIMEKWSKHGFRFSLRICTYEGSAKMPYTTPEYVYRAGAKGYVLPDGRLQPDYGDPIFLDKLGAFMALAGQKFNNDPRIELIDIGTFGTWGEGHTVYGDETVYPVAVIKKHIDLHVQNFPNTFILLNDDHINYGWPRGEADNVALMDYALNLGLGLQDDSACCAVYIPANGYHTLRTPWMFDLFWENAPIALELHHYNDVDPHIFKGGLPFIEAMRQIHATFAGFHGYPRPWLTREPYLTEYCANRLGYWYFIKGIEMGALKNNAPNFIRLWVENRGFGLCYHRYTLRLMVRGTDGSEYQEEFDAGNRRWHPNRETCVPLTFTPKGLREGNYAVYLGLFENNTPIQLAIQADKQSDGYYYICDIPVTK